MEAAQARKRVRALEGERRRHKAAMRSHKERLRAVAAEIKRLRAWCDANGVELIIEHTGEGDPHGRQHPVSQYPTTRPNRHD